MHSIEIRIFEFFNGLAGRSSLFDTLAGSFTELAFLIFLFFLSICFFFIPALRQRKIRRSILFAGLSGALTVTISFALSAIFYRARPFVALPADQIQQIVSHVADSSFPSNHAAGSAGLAFGAWRTPNAVIRWLTMGIALLVGISRMVVGVHWPSDVVFSFLLGALVVGVLHALLPRLTPVFDLVLNIIHTVENWVRQLIGLTPLAWDKAQDPVEAMPAQRK